MFLFPWRGPTMSSKCPTGRCDSNQRLRTANARRCMPSMESKRVRAPPRQDELALRPGRVAEQRPVGQPVPVAAPMPEDRKPALGRARVAAGEEHNKGVATQVAEAAVRA